MPRLMPSRIASRTHRHVEAQDRWLPERHITSISIQLFMPTWKPRVTIWATANSRFCFYEGAEVAKDAMHLTCRTDKFYDPVTLFRPGLTGGMLLSKHPGDLARSGGAGFRGRFSERSVERVMIVGDLDITSADPTSLSRPSSPVRLE